MSKSCKWRVHVGCIVHKTVEVTASSESEAEQAAIQAVDESIPWDADIDYFDSDTEAEEIYWDSETVEEEAE